MKKSNIIKSTLILSIAAILSKFLGSVFRIPLQNLAGDEVLGIFTLVYPLYMVALTLSVAGIPLAISLLIADADSEKNTEKIKDIFHTSSILAVFFGFFSFLVIFSFSTQLSFLLGGSSVRPALLIVSATLLIAPYMAVYRGFFQGFGAMNPTAISQVIEQFVRVAVILAIAYFMTSQNYTDEAIAGGVMIGSVLGAIASLIYLRRLFLLSDKRITGFSRRNFKTTGKRILKVSLPLSVGALTMAVLNLVDSLTIPVSLIRFGHSPDNINYLYGIYGRGLALIQIVTVFATSAVLPLIPAITVKIAQGKMGEVKNIARKSFSLILLFSLPAAVVSFILAEPINFALFTNTEGTGVLAIILAGSLLTSLSVLGTGILQSIQKAKIAAYLVIVAVVIKVVLNLVFIPYFGLTAAAASTVVVYLLLFLLNSYFIWKYIGVRFSPKKLGGVIFSAALSGFAAWLASVFWGTAYDGRFVVLLELSASIFLAAAVYMIALMSIGIIDAKKAGRKIRSSISRNKPE